jgi:hypothetical protein
VRVKLYITVEHAYVVYGHETFGINLVFLHASYSSPRANEPNQP